MDCHCDHNGANAILRSCAMRSRIPGFTFRENDDARMSPLMLMASVLLPISRLGHDHLKSAGTDAWNSSTACRTTRSLHLCG